MKKIIILGFFVFAITACRSSRPRYLRCPKGKRCVQKTVKEKQFDLVFLENRMLKTQNKSNFNTLAN